MPRPTRYRSTKPLDANRAASAFARPGLDTRVWNSNGVVSAEGGDCVFYDDDLGQLVRVVLQPTGVECVCRVAMGVAGPSEGEGYPFVAGDAVVVCLPEGSPRAGGIIIGRLSSRADPFPKDPVAGQDPRANAVGVRKQKAGQVFESDGPIVVRHAPTGALVAIDAKGGVTIRNGDGAGFQLSSDALSLLAGDGKCLVQVDVAQRRVTLQAGDALAVLSDSGADHPVNALATPGALTISTAAQPAAEHATTAEALALLLAVLGPLITSGGGVLPPIPTSGWTSAHVALALQAASIAALDPLVAGSIRAAFAAAAQKPPADPALGQVRPGLGCSGLIVG